MARAISYPLIIIALILGFIEFLPSAKWFFGHLPRYQYVGIGMLVYWGIFFLKVFQKNLEWLRTFSHELSHTIVGMLFLRKIHSFNAGEGSGEMVHSGGLRFGDIFISLAPYCLPIFTWMLLLLRELSAARSIYIFDILIGITIAFHIDCFRTQIGNYQTDIKNQGYTRSYLFIIAMWFINLTIILESIRRGLFEGLTHTFSGYWESICSFFAWVAEKVI